MRYLQALTTILILALGLSSCQMAQEREGHRSQALLDEADLLIKTRDLGKAKSLAEQALEKLKPLRESQPKHLDFHLLEVRAHITKFIAQNVLVMEEAEIKPRSLVRLPSPDQFVDFDKTVPVAEKGLLQLASREKELDLNQSAFVHGMLAAIYRLKDTTLDKAIEAYEKAIDRYSEQLKLAQADRDKNKIKIEQYESQIRGLRMAQVEVSLLDEDWESALDQAQQAMAGPDLKYFDVRFDLLENAIERIELKLEEEKRLQEGSREQKLLQALAAKKQKSKSKTEEIGGYNPYKVALIKNQIELENTQNNLIYRIICYHNLGDTKRLNRAREILRKHYPGVATELDSKMQQYQ